MGKDISVTREEVHQCLTGILMHFKVTNIAANYDSFAHAMHELGLWDYAFHEAEVLAYAYKYNQHLYNLLHSS